MLRKIIFFFFLSIIVIYGCAPKHEIDKKKVPAELIQPREMIGILTDIQLTEATLKELRRSGENPDDFYKDYYEKIFKKHNVTKEEYDKSMTFYEDNLDLLQEIYEEVITNLSKIQSEVFNSEQ